LQHLSHQKEKETTHVAGKKPKVGMEYTISIKRGERGGRKQHFKGDEGGGSLRTPMEENHLHRQMKGHRGTGDRGREKPLAAFFHHIAVEGGEHREKQGKTKAVRMTQGTERRRGLYSCDGGA